MVLRLSEFFKHNRGPKVATVFSAPGSGYLLYQSISNIDFDHFDLTDKKDLCMFLGGNILGAITIGLLVYLYLTRNVLASDLTASQNSSHASAAPVTEGELGAPRPSPPPPASAGCVFLITQWGNKFKSEHETFKREVTDGDSLTSYAQQRGGDYLTQFVGNKTFLQTGAVDSLKQELQDHESFKVRIVKGHTFRRADPETAKRFENIHPWQW